MPDDKEAQVQTRRVSAQATPDQVGQHGLKSERQQDGVEKKPSVPLKPPLPPREIDELSVTFLEAFKKAASAIKPDPPSRRKVVLECMQIFAACATVFALFFVWRQYDNLVQPKLEAEQRAVQAEAAKVIAEQKTITAQSRALAAVSQAKAAEERTRVALASEAAASLAASRADASANRAQERTRSAESTLYAAQAATKLANTALSALEAQQAQAYKIVRASVFEAIATRIQTCEVAAFRRINQPNRASEESCFRREDRSDDALYQLLQSEDEDRLDRARELAQKDFRTKVQEAWAAVLKRETDARSALAAYAGEKRSKELMDLYAQQSTAADREAEFPIFAIPQMARRQLVDALGEDWGAGHR